MLGRIISSVPPPLKWAGGKRWLLPILLPLWERYGGAHLVEPFVGGMAVALGLQPACAILNDVNPHLINFYSNLKKGLQIDLDMQNDAEAYYQFRSRFNSLIEQELADTKEAATLFYYLNRTGYNGLCRFNRRGLFNVPFGKHKNIGYVNDFTKYQAILRDWEIVHGDFGTLKPAASAFIYADPPYDGVFTSYSAGGFSWADQVRLAHWLAAQPGPVVASNQATPRILALYAELGFEIEIIAAPRRIACTGDRRAAAEMLAHKHIG